MARASVKAIYATHDRAMGIWRELIAKRDADWERPIESVTRSQGTLTVTPRTLLIHTLMHSIRHYAGLATQVRYAGIHPEWQMDYC